MLYELDLQIVLLFILYHGIMYLNLSLVSDE